MSLGPAALVRTIPAALGRAPADELVLVGVSELSAAAAVILTTHIAVVDTDDEADEVSTFIAAAVGQLRRDGATRLAVLVYADDALTPDSTPARYAATAVVIAEAAGLGVLDAVAVAAGRWRSYDCTNTSCCPPEGTPITEGPTP